MAQLIDPLRTNNLGHITETLHAHISTSRECNGNVRDRVKTSECEDLRIIVSQGDCFRAHPGAEYAWESRSCMEQQLLSLSKRCPEPVHFRAMYSHLHRI